MKINETKEAEIYRMIDVETQLTHRQAMILVALTLGSYNDLGIGSTFGRDAGESTLLELGFIEMEDGELQPTALGRTTARWFMAGMIDVISPNLGMLLEGS